jgi:phosphoglycerate dehydrogenase-like enzyme
MKGFDVDVLAIRRSFEPGMTAPNVDELLGPASLHDMLGRCDSVVLAAAGTPETENLIGKAEFAAMKPGSVFVNVARGTMVDEDALVAALENGTVGGAALDVFEHEPVAPDRWREVPRTVLTPHIAGFTREAGVDMRHQQRENVRRYFAGEPLLTPVHDPL